MPEVRIDNGATQPLIDEELAAFDELVQEVLRSTDESSAISVGDEYFQGLPPLAEESSLFGIPREITEAKILKQRFTRRPPLPTAPEADSDSNQ